MFLVVRQYSTNMNSNPSRPVMFPCATQVSLIEVGADDFDVKVKDYKFLQRRVSGHGPSNTKGRHNQGEVKKPVLQKISAGLTFTDEVCY